jgi:hypothetical protein
MVRPMLQSERGPRLRVQSACCLAALSLSAGTRPLPHFTSSGEHARYVLKSAETFHNVLPIRRRREIHAHHAGFVMVERDRNDRLSRIYPVNIANLFERRLNLLAAACGIKDNG